MTVSTSVSPDARRVWRAARGPLAILALVVAAGIGIALMRGISEGGDLDPRSATPGGSRAIAQVLADHGVRVEPAFQAAHAERQTGGWTTLVVVRPALLRPDDLRRIAADARDVVLVESKADTAGALLPGVKYIGGGNIAATRPGCDFPPARAAGAATLGGISYDIPGAAHVQRCYPAGDGFGLLHGKHDTRRVTLLGSGAPLTNAALADEGNAALAMRLLGGHDRVVWYVPTPGDPALADGDESLLDLLPDGWKFAIVQLVVAAAVFALWRARRLGPVVAEPLPVVVRAAETTEGRTLLYRKARARGHAADALRAATRDRITTRLGLPRDTEPDAVVAAVAERTARRDDSVRALLYGPAPTSDTELVRIADALDLLDNEVT